MEEHESKQSNKLNISPFWTDPAIMTVLTAGINFFCDDEKLKIFLALLAPFVASLIAYILQYLTDSRPALPGFFMPGSCLCLAVVKESLTTELVSKS